MFINSKRFRRLKETYRYFKQTYRESNCSTIDISCHLNHDIHYLFHIERNSYLLILSNLYITVTE